MSARDEGQCGEHLFDVDVRTGSYTGIKYMNGYMLGLGRSFGLAMTTTATLLNLVKLRTAISLDQLVYK